MASHNTQMSHIDLFLRSFFDQRHSSQTIVISGPTVRHLLKQKTDAKREIHKSHYPWKITALISSTSEANRINCIECAIESYKVLLRYLKKFGVNFVDDLQMAWQKTLKEKDRPALEGLGENRVIGVGTGANHHVPGLTGRQNIRLKSLKPYKPIILVVINNQLHNRFD